MHQIGLVTVQHILTQFRIDNAQSQRSRHEQSQDRVRPADGDALQMWLTALTNMKWDCRGTAGKLSTCAGVNSSLAGRNGSLGVSEGATSMHQPRMSVGAYFWWRESETTFPGPTGERCTHCSGYWRRKGTLVSMRDIIAENQPTTTLEQSMGFRDVHRPASGVSEAKRKGERSMSV
ncbi:hypothetical protein EI94DRAFT_1887660 [Lactarius quietus]|nr:hypothetical protein EI94DRAFT_1887660 [Lactarius quietus]